MYGLVGAASICFTRSVDWTIYTTYRNSLYHSRKQHLKMSKWKYIGKNPHKFTPHDQSITCPPSPAVCDCCTCCCKQLWYFYFVTWLEGEYDAGASIASHVSGWRWNNFNLSVTLPAVVSIQPIRLSKIWHQELNLPWLSQNSQCSHC